MLNDSLVEEALKLTKIKTKRELIDLVLKEFVENHKRKNLAELEGKIKFAEGYDYKSMRKGIIK